MKNRNVLLGWLTFLIAFTVYYMTAERTGSWWDCGEFLASDYKLQIPHQPGAPLYVMIYKVFMLFAGHNKMHLAFFANLGSAFVSALTITFLFWTICALCQKTLKTNTSLSASKKHFLVVSAGLIGSLSYAFSDTFWFSAVEAEVYALSSLFTAVSFWAIIRWENDQSIYANRWILFISILMGLSVGVHLLNLLCIPALLFVAWGKYRTLNIKGILSVSLISILILFLILEIFIPGTVNLAAKIDLFAVNQLSLPFGTGVIFFIFLNVMALGSALIFAISRKFLNLQLTILSVVFFFIGYSSFTQVIIRAEAGPPLNHSAATNPFSFYSYLTRQQYPAAPLLYGPYYDAGNPVSAEKMSSIYRPLGNRYAFSAEQQKYHYQEDRNTWFPRLWETDNNKADFYRSWLGLSKDYKPNFTDNLRFLFSYQVSHMFLRYFMWNFAGRQNDEVGYGDSRSGNWISGIKPLDALRLGSQNNLPQTIVSNKAYNRLFLLPFIIGIAGLVFQLKRSKKDFISLAVLFFFTGIAIILFLNQGGPEPRERDYSFGGAFYTFSIWIGLGVPALAIFLSKFIKSKISTGIAVASCMLVPILMISQEYNDHDRSGRTLVRDIASNYLNSCAPNSVLFTYADNDTYPLWYAQEVEGIRPDVRVVIQPFLASDWYIEQLHKKINQADPLKFTIKSSQYFGVQRDYIPFVDSNLQGYTELSDVIDMIGSEDPAAKVELNDGLKTNFLASRKLKISASAASEKSISWILPQNHLYKSDLAELDFISSNKWQRPIYFGAEIPSSAYLGLDKYIHMEGLAYRLQPANEDSNLNKSSALDINTDVMYDNVMQKFKWGNENHGEYLDPTSKQKIALLRQTCLDLSARLLQKGDRNRSWKVLEKVFSNTPDAWSRLEMTPDSIGLCYINLNASGIYYQLNQKTRAQERINVNIAYIRNQLDYIISAHLKTNDQAIQSALDILKLQAQTASANHDQAFASHLEEIYTDYSTKLM